MTRDIMVSALVSLLRTTVLDVQVAGTIDDAEQVKSWIEEAGTTKLRERGVEDQDWRIGVEVSGSTYDYRVQLTLERAGAPLAIQPDAVICECTNEELIGAIESAVDEGIAALEREPKPVSEPPHDGGQTDPAPHVEPNHRDVKPLGPLGGVGIAAMVVGVGGIAGGIPLAIKDDEVRIRMDNRQAERTTTKPPGIALATLGGALLATGAVLLAVDVVRRKKSRTAFTPTLTPHGVAFTVRGSF